MTICFITDHPFSEREGTYFSGGGIPADMLRRYVRGESKLIVIGRKSSKQNQTLSSIPNSEFHLMDNYHTPIDIFLKNVLLKKELTQYIQKADGVIIRMPNVLGSIVCQVCKHLGKPFSIEVCGSAYDSFHNYGSIIGKIAAPWYEKMVARIVATSDFVLYVTQEYLQKEYPHKPTATTIACSNVALPQLIPISVLENRLNRIMFHKGNKYIFGQIGNVEVMYKGYSIVLQAISALQKQGIDVTYEIVGGGKPKKLMEEARKYGVEKSLVVRGKINHEKIPEFMEHIDIYVHPSFQEGVPRAVVEAISNAVPSIVSDTAGTSELVNRIWVHKAGDVKKFTNDLFKMIQNKDLMLQASKDNFERAKNYYPDVLNSRRNKYYDMFFNSL